MRIDCIHSCKFNYHTMTTTTCLDTIIQFNVFNVFNLLTLSYIVYLFLVLYAPGVGIYLYKGTYYCPDICISIESTHTCMALCKTFPGSLNVPIISSCCNTSQSRAFRTNLSSMKIYCLACANDFTTNAVNLQ